MEDQGGLVDLEQSRQQLESNVAKLRASLRHWQQWEIDYEGMKEELLHLGPRYSRNDLQTLVNSNQDGLFDGSLENLLNTKERKLLMYDDKGKLRSAKDIIGLLSRRTDYVQRNVRSLTSLLSAAEQELAASTGLLEHEERKDEGLPLTEIHEELDEDGNVISTATSHPGEDSPNVIEALKKAGIDGLPEKQLKRGPDTSTDGMSPVQADSESANDSDNVSSTWSQNTKEDSPERETWTSDSHQSDHQSTKRRRPNTRKRVSFAEGTKPEDDPSEHPIKLPKESQIQCLQDTCSQLRQQLGKQVASRRLNPLSNSFQNAALLDKSNSIAIASQILRIQQNRQAKRLLKACELDLRGAATVLCQMAETNDYDLESPQIAHVIADERDSRSAASSSRDSSPGAVNNTVLNADLNKLSSRESRRSSKLPFGNGLSETTKQSKGSNGVITSPVIPNDENLDDTALRRQMLQYNMNEVGSVVAELNLEDGDDGYGDFNSDDDVDMDVDDGDDEDEDDEHGKTVAGVLSADYIAEMRALEAKLRARAMVNAGPDTSTEPPVNGQTNGPIVSNGAKVLKKNGVAKGVRFAGDVEIKEIPETPHLTEAPVIERKQPQVNGSTVVPKAKKSSRFRASRSAQRPAAKATADEDETSPPAPENKPPLGSRPIIEREINPNNAKPSEPDDLEPAFHQQQVRTEYHRLRNKMIANEGGFSRLDDESEEIILDDAEGYDGGRKMSRFRAARLGLQ